MKITLASCSFLVFVPLASSQELLLELHGEYWGEGFGKAIQGAGDIDGDGTDDFLMYRSLPANRSAVELRCGASGAVLQAWHVDEPLFGSLEMDGLGDMNGDGVGDVAIAWRQGAAMGSSWVRLYSGATGALLHEWLPTVVSQTFPIHVRGMGDLDDDGMTDYIICSGGYMRAFSGVDHSEIYSVPVHDFRWDIERLGDLDGDGKPEWIGGGQHTAMARVCSGATGATLYSFQEGDIGPIGGHFGQIVANVGYFDEDHVQDFAVAQPNWNSGRIWVYSGADGSLIRRLLPPPGAWHPWPTGMTAADIDGDGQVELLAVGERQLDAMSRDGTSLFSASFGYLVWRPFELLASRQLGDVDGDGAEDILLASRYGPAGDYTGSVFILAANRDCNGNQILDLKETSFGVNDCNGNLVPDSCDIASGFSFDLDGGGSPDECNCALGAPFCGGTATGNTADLSSWGVASVSQTSYHLRVAYTTGGDFGIFLLGPEVNNVPMGGGTLCLANPQRMGSVVPVTNGFSAVTQVDFVNSSAVLIQSGQTWRFQFWYRTGGTVNFSEALEQTFCP